MTNIDEHVARLLADQVKSQVQVFYRFVYFLPNTLAQEAIAVGLILHDPEHGIRLFSIESPTAQETLAAAFGTVVREEVRLALKTLKNQLAETNSLDSCFAASTILSLGQTTEGFTEHPTVFGRELLRMGSSLFRYSLALEISHAASAVGQEQVLQNLRRQVEHKQLLTGTRLFKGKEVKLDATSSFKIPIFGEAVYGAPFSMVTPRVTEATKHAEASVARLRAAKNSLKGTRKPVIYVLLPENDSVVNRDKAFPGFNELKHIGRASSVSVYGSESLDELAERLLEDEGSPKTDAVVPFPAQPAHLP